MSGVLTCIQGHQGSGHYVETSRRAGREREEREEGPGRVFEEVQGIEGREA
jgi:hypothetical protein